MKSFDVIVVGGGPVGLWTACELRLGGMNVAVLERRSKRVEQSRTMELFAMRGIARRILAEDLRLSEPSGSLGSATRRGWRHGIATATSSRSAMPRISIFPPVDRK